MKSLNRSSDTPRDLAFGDLHFCDLEDLAAFIAHSQIVVSAAGLAEIENRARRLPAGFDGVDVAILEWIAAEGRRARRGLARM